jgi:hypothetical protein
MEVLDVEMNSSWRGRNSWRFLLREAGRQSQLGDKFRELLPRQGLGQAVSWHLAGRGPVERDSAFLDFLSEPVSMDINISELCIEFILLLLKEAHCLAIVAPNADWLLRIKPNRLEETPPPDDLPRGSG